MKTLILTLVSLVSVAQVRIPGPGGVAAAGGGGNPAAFVSAASNNQTASANSITTTGSLTIGTGDLIVVKAAIQDRTPTSITCGSNSLASGMTWLNGGYSIQVWFKQGATAGTTTCTATFNDVGTYRVISAANYSGAATSGGILQSSYNASGVNTIQTTSTNRTAANVTTTTANTIHIACGVDWDGTAGTHTATNGYTVRIDGDTEYWYDKFPTSTGSYPGGNFGTTASTDGYVAFYLVFGAA